MFISKHSHRYTLVLRRYRFSLIGINIHKYTLSIIKSIEINSNFSNLAIIGSISLYSQSYILTLMDVDNGQVV